MSKIYVFKHYPPTPTPPFLGPGTFALNSRTYNPLFEKILEPPLVPESHFLLSANVMVSCKYVFHAGPGLFVFFAGCSILYRSKKQRMDSTFN